MGKHGWPEVAILLEGPFDRPDCQDGECVPAPGGAPELPYVAGCLAVEISLREGHAAAEKDRDPRPSWPHQAVEIAQLDLLARSDKLKAKPWRRPNGI